MTDGALPHVVVVGAGFGGLQVVRGLRRARVRVTMIDCRNHHLFQPLLYQVATAGLSPADIAAPIRRLVSGEPRTRVVLGRASSVDVEGRRLRLEDGAEVPYDFLVVATGVTHTYFGHDEWAEHAPPLKSVEDALEIRRRVLFAFEAAEREPDPTRRSALLTFVVVGGGATGVELAGALAELSRYTLVRQFATFDPRDARVVLCEGGPRLLPAFPERLSGSAARQLQSLGVEVMLEQRVSQIDAQGVSLASGERITARTVMWAAGVAGTPIARSLDGPLDRAGRVLVTPHLTVPGHPELYVIGDLAALPQEDGSLVPGVAPAAIQMGQHAARSIRDRLLERPLQPFRYRDKGDLATIGRKRAVARLGKACISGGVAWCLWVVVHILYLVGFRNRAVVMLQWIWAYFTYQRGARLITERVDAPRKNLAAPDADAEA
jgi:NADH:quinone reductase (non-electrogenic)